MPGSPVRLGPFVGGINTQADPSSIRDDELVDCINLELDLDGSLISRPPLVDVTGTTNIGVMGGQIVCLGYGIFSGDRYYLFACGPAGVGVFYNNVWTLIAPGVRSKSIVQYADKVWIVAKYSSTAPGGWYNPDSAPAYNAVAAMPKGSTIISYKGRLWICAGREAPPQTASRMWFSNVDPALTTWSPADFIDFNQGDGQFLIDLVIYNNVLTAFKTDSTYTYPFDSDPSLGLITKVSGTIGATKDFCVVLYENVLYCYHEGWVYELSNYVFQRLNTKVPFVYESPTVALGDEQTFLTIFGDRLLVRYYRRVYSFNLRTRTWTRFKASNTNFITGPFVPAPTTVVSRKNIEYYAGTNVVGVSKLIKTSDGFDAVAKEEMTCSILTKNYDISISHRFKKLFWWGLDCSSVDPVKGINTIITPSFSLVTTWGDASQYKWGDLATWGNPIAIPQTGTVTSSIPTTSNRPSRIFVKFLKALRYRQINFQVILTTDGSTARGPVRIYSLTAFTNAKETVVAAVS